MEIISRSVYVGPNVFAKLPLIRLTVDLHRRAETPVVGLRATRWSRCSRSCPASPPP